MKIHEQYYLIGNLYAIATFVVYGGNFAVIVCGLFSLAHFFYGIYLREKLK